MHDQNRPAIAGGPKAKTTPYGTGPRYGEEELNELREALDQQTLFYVSGKKVKRLEQDIAGALGARFAVATSSGTAALHAALCALDISPGDEVITSPITDMGTLAPILFQGGVPVFADVDPHTYNIDPASVKARITSRTRAIVAVHLAGNSCDLDALLAIARKHNVVLVEDCAQSWGATYHGKSIGTFGRAGCFSFNEFKHISCGDGGIVVTDDEPLAKRIRLATDKGYRRDATFLERDPAFLANNYRMSELQAAVAIAQLKKLPSIVTRRRDFCTKLVENLRDIPGLALPRVTLGCASSWWFFMFRVNDATGTDASTFADALQQEGLPVRAHYIGRPVYRYPLFAAHSAFARAPHPFTARNYEKESCPTAESILATCLQLVINENYTADDLEQTIAAIKKVAAWYRK